MFRLLADVARSGAERFAQLTAVETATPRGGCCFTYARLWELGRAGEAEPRRARRIITLLLRPGWPGLGLPLRVLRGFWRRSLRHRRLFLGRRFRARGLGRRSCHGGGGYRRSRRGGLSVAVRLQRKIIRAARRGRQRLALHENAGRDRISMRSAVAGATQQLLGGGRRNRQRDHRPRHRARGRLAIRRRRRDRSRWKRDRSHAAVHMAADFALDIVRKLERDALCEEDAVVRSQSPHLAFIVGAEVRVFAGFVDEAVPDVDVDHAGALGAGAIKVIEIDRVGGRLRAANRRQPDPEYRHTLALESCDRVVDAL